MTSVNLLNSACIMILSWPLQFKLWKQNSFQLSTYKTISGNISRLMSIGKMLSSFFVQSPTGNIGFLPPFLLQLEKKKRELTNLLRQHYPHLHRLSARACPRRGLRHRGDVPSLSSLCVSVQLFYLPFLTNGPKPTTALYFP